MTTLGEKLSGLMAEMSAAGVKPNDMAGVNIKSLRKERKLRERLVDEVQKQLIAAINDDQIPRVNVTTISDVEWLLAADRTQATHQPVWNKMVRFFEDEGLTVIVAKSHDGAGMGSWAKVSLKPIPPKNIVYRGGASGGGTGC